MSVMLNESSVIYSMWKKCNESCKFHHATTGGLVLDKEIMSSLEYLRVQLYIMAAIYSETSEQRTLWGQY